MHLMERNEHKFVQNLWISVKISRSIFTPQINRNHLSDISRAFTQGIICPIWSSRSLRIQYFVSEKDLPRENLLSLWTTMGYYGPLWSTVIHYGLLWNIKGHYGPLWSTEPLCSPHPFQMLNSNQS